MARRDTGRDRVWSARMGATAAHVGVAESELSSGACGPERWWSEALNSVECVRPGVIGTVEHPGGSTSVVSMVTCRVSSRLVVVLHEGYLHTGTGIRLGMPTLAGADDAVEGVVRACRHVSGRVHHSVLEFESGLGVHRYVAWAGDASGLVGMPNDVRGVRGRVLHLDACCEGRERLVESLSQTSLEVVGCESLEAASEQAASGVWDLLISELVVGLVAVPDLVEGVRGIGCSCPLIVLAEEGNPYAARAATVAGAEAVLGKPYVAEALVALVASVMPELSGQDEPADTCESLAARLREAILHADATACGDALDRLLGVVLGPGFEATAVQVRRARRELDDAGSVAGVERVLERLLVSLDRIRSRAA